MRVNIPTRFSNRPAAKMRILYFAIPVVAIAIILAISLTITAEITGDSARRLSRQYSIETAANFITGTNAHFLLSQQLAKSTTIARWMADEDDEELRARAVEEIVGYSDFVQDMFLVFTVYDTRNIYDLHPGFTADDIVSRRQIPELPYSQWFFDVRDAELPFTLNIQRSTHIDGGWTINVWTNHRMYYQDRFVGIATTAAPFATVFNNMFGDFDMASRRGYIIDQYGLVRADSAELLEVFENGWPRPSVLPEAVDNPDLADAINLHLQTMVDGAFQVGGAIGDAVPLQGDFRYASIAPIIGTNWSVVVLSNQGGLFGATRFIPLMFIGVAALILLVWGSVALMYSVEREGLALAQEKEKEFMKRQQQIYDASPIIGSLWTADVQIIDCNESAVKMLELSSKDDYISRFYDFVPECQPCGTLSNEYLANWAEEARKAGRSDFVWAHLTSKGELVRGDVAFVRIDLDDGHMFAAFMQDLRPVLAAMEREQEATRRQKLIYEATPTPASLWSSDMKILDCNEALLKLVGLSSKDDYINNFSNFVPEYQPDGTLSTERIVAVAEAAAKEGRANCPWIHITASGESVPGEITAVRIDLSDHYMFAVSMQDLRPFIAAQENERALESQLHKQELLEKEHEAQKRILEEINNRERLLSVGNQAAQVLLTANEENSREALMQGFEIMGSLFDVERVLMWQHEEIDGELHFLLRYVWLSELGKQKKRYASDSTFRYSDDPEYCDNILNGININGPVSELPSGVRAHFTEYDTLSATVLPMLLDGKIIGFFSLHDCKTVRTFSKDEIDIMTSVGLMITSVYYKIAQSALEKEFEQERRRIEAAEESNRAKSAFLARMSHEIRTPITAVMGISEIELQDPDLSPHLEESFAKMHSAANHLLNIVNDVLDLSKIEAGKMELLQEKYEMASMIVDAIQLNAVLGDGKDIKFNVSIDANLPAYLIGDVVRIKQIINNILSNAFKYTESGTVELSLNCHKETPEDEYATMVISIKDTGHGMTAKQLEGIADEYTRHHERDFRNIDGTGLGMSIVYSLVQLMGAEIDIDSEVGVGTSVVVRIPQKVVGSEVLGEELALSLQQFEDVMKITGKRFGIEPESMPYGSVLVVDDVDANLYVTRGLLAFYDLQIETCTNGYDAVKLIEQGNAYDIIFLDHMMPGMNGTETMLRLRELGYWYPIVVLTANAIIGQAEEFIKSGFDGFISKPIQTKRLNDILIKHIKNKQPPEVIEAAKASIANNIHKADIDSFQRDPALLAKLRVDFAKNYRNAFSELRNSIDTDDIEAARRLAHTIKGAALLFDDALVYIAEEVEQVLAKEEKPTNAQLFIFEREMKRVLALADAVEIDAPLSAEEYMSAGEAIILLEKITPLLADKKAAVVKMIDELRKVPKSELLCEQIERFDFKSAFETLAKLKKDLGA